MFYFIFYDYYFRFVSLCAVSFGDPMLGMTIMYREHILIRGVSFTQQVIIHFSRSQSESTLSSQVDARQQLGRKRLRGE